MFTSKIVNFALGIVEAEGWVAGSISGNQYFATKSYVNHNPGNLRASPLAVSTNEGFAVFENDMVGFAALLYLLVRYTKGIQGLFTADDTIEKAMSVYTSLAVGSPFLNNYLTLLEKRAPIKRSDAIKSLLN